MAASRSTSFLQRVAPVPAHPKLRDTESTGLRRWLGRWRRAARPRPERARLTRVGLWYVLFVLVVLLAATNTGNNGLYLVLALMGAVLVVSFAMAWVNLRDLALELAPAEECFANSPSSVRLSIVHGGRWLPRSMLVARVEAARGAVRSRPLESTSIFVGRLAPGARHDAEVEVLPLHRGRWRLEAVRVRSLHPFGLVSKGVRHPVDDELLVYPELFAPPAGQPERLSRPGEEASRLPGWGHDLLALRTFRDGDDPRGIHWKQTARTGRMIFKEREREEGRRLSIVFDNAVGELRSPAARRRFERLVSEAATAAVDYLERGFEVELVTREDRLAFGAGLGQRRAILERLALIQPLPGRRSAEPLATPGASHLLLALEPEEVA